MLGGRVRTRRKQRLVFGVVGGAVWGGDLKTT